MLVAPEVLPVVLPYLTLQQLVGNAVRHGLDSIPGGGTINIIAEDAGTECVISVEDNGIGMDPKRLIDQISNPPDAHLRLKDVDDALRSAFGDDYGLIVETERGAGMKVSMRIPKFNVRAVRPPQEQERGRG